MVSPTCSPDTTTSREITATPVVPKLNAVGMPAELSARNRTVPPPASAARTLSRSVGTIPVGTTTRSGDGRGSDLAIATEGTVMATSEISTNATKPAPDNQRPERQFIRFLADRANMVTAPFSRGAQATHFKR